MHSEQSDHSDAAKVIGLRPSPPPPPSPPPGCEDWRKIQQISTSDYSVNTAETWVTFTKHIFCSADYESGLYRSYCVLGKTPQFWASDSN